MWELAAKDCTVFLFISQNFMRWLPFRVQYWLELLQASILNTNVDPYSDRHILQSCVICSRAINRCICLFKMFWKYCEIGRIWYSVINSLHLFVLISPLKQPDMIWKWKFLHLRQIFSFKDILTQVNHKLMVLHILNHEELAEVLVFN